MHSWLQTAPLIHRDSIMAFMALCKSRIIIIIIIIISARQHICYSALYAITCPPVCPSVCLSVTRVDQSKTVEVRIMQPSGFTEWPRDSTFLTLNFTVKFQREDREYVGAPNDRVGKIRSFQPISRRISEKVQDRTKVTIND